MELTKGKSGKASGVSTPQLTRLPIPVPPNLEAVLGYPGRERFMGFWFFQGGLHIEDRATDTNRPTFMVLGLKLFIEHPAMIAMTRDLGLRLLPADFHSMADHGLLLDRKDRTLFVGRTTSITQFIRPPFPEILPSTTTSYSPVHPYTQTKAAERIQSWVDTTLDPFWAMVQEGLRRAGPGGC